MAVKIMKKFLILLISVMILFSGCVSQKTVKMGDNVSVDYTGSLQDGRVFDTSIEKVAMENNLFPGREYKPLNFTVGNGEVIKGFDEGVIGMMVGESKTLIIPPEKGYGPIDPKAIQAIPIIQTVPATSTLPKVFDLDLALFQQAFGPNQKVGGIVKIPNTNINLTILNINSTSVSLAYKLKVGDQISPPNSPWNATVVKIDDKNITVTYNAEKNSTIQFFSGTPWKTTVIDVNNKTITIRHIAVPDTEIPSTLGTTRIHFNETSIIMDRNPPLAGMTLVFNVTLRSIK
jgi:FKBP-type peptidyl-prolyl cis-trans isomerase 2